MPLFQSTQVRQRMPVPSLQHANKPTAIYGEFVVPTGGLAISDVIEMGGLAANMRVMDFLVLSTAMGASATFDAGILSRGFGVTTGTARTCGNEFIAASAWAVAAVTRLLKPVTVDPTPASENPADDMLGWGLKVTGAVLPAGAVIRAWLTVISK